MSKCQACQSASAEWSWQPAGPDETPYTFMALGAHYRGFLVVKVCETCHQRISRNEAVQFTYRKHIYMFVAGQITAV